MLALLAKKYTVTLAHTHTPFQEVSMKANGRTVKDTAEAK